MQVPAHILVIEDHPANLKLMVYLLSAFGYRLASARDGMAGLEAARAGAFDLILCDVHLPKLDGYGVVAELKRDAALCKTPAIAVTALAMVGDRDKILAAGFDGYISKPIVPEAFVEQVEAFLPPGQRSAGRPAKSDRPASPRRVAAPLKNITILLVDDTPANISFARSTLEPSGYTIFAARSVREAIAVIAERRPALILSDLHMPGQSGHDFLEIAQGEPALRGIPVVIISSTFTNIAEAEGCRARGAAAFVRRPIEPEQLLAEIEAVLKAADTARRAAESNPESEK
ncbi:MAG: response regulator [Chthoniobacteraceae bacterium]